MKVFSRLSPVYGVSFGSVRTVICDGEGMLLLDEATCVTKHQHTGQYMVLGNDARQLDGRVPNEVELIWPVRRDSVVQSEEAFFLLSHWMESLQKKTFLGMIPPKCVISLSSDATEVHRRTVRRLFEKVGVQKVLLVEKCMAALAGARGYADDGVMKDLAECKRALQAKTAQMIVLLGYDTLDIAVFSAGNTLVSETVPFGTQQYLHAVQHFFSVKHDVLIGTASAEHVLAELGSAAPFDNDSGLTMVVRGKHRTTGMPFSVRVRSEDLREVLIPTAQEIVKRIRTILKKCPVGISAEIQSAGLLFCDDEIHVREIETYIADQLNIPVVSFGDTAAKSSAVGADTVRGAVSSKNTAPAAALIAKGCSVLSKLASKGYHFGVLT